MRNNVGKKENIHTLPDGIWEGSTPQKAETEKTKQQHQENLQTDEQKNGYPQRPYKK